MSHGGGAARLRPHWPPGTITAVANAQSVMVSMVIVSHHARTPSAAETARRIRSLRRPLGIARRSSWFPAPFTL
jgi:hypothetical protein